MDIEFHYWIAGIIAHAAGFNQDDAFTIAYSSQFVDDNDLELEIYGDPEIDPYKNFVSQTMNPLKPRRERLQIYPYFHFIPGDPHAESARRRDGKMHILNTIPDSDLANKMMEDAFNSPEETRLYRIGIATHAYADTWAHQNFAGFSDNFNGDDLNPVPNIGHAEAGHHPDMVGHRWQDNRILAESVDNNARFLQAAYRIFSHFCEYNGMEGDWAGLEKSFRDIMGPAKTIPDFYDKENRIKQYKEIAPWLEDYDERTWHDAAIEVDVKGLEDSYREGVRSALTFLPDKRTWRVKKEDTDWYKFQEAVKEHQAFMRPALNQLFLQMGISFGALNEGYIRRP